LINCDRLTFIWVSQINTQMAVADPLDDVIVDKNGMCRWSDVAAAQTHIRQAQEDRIEALESARCVTSAAGAS